MWALGTGVRAGIGATAGRTPVPVVASAGWPAWPAAGVAVAVTVLVLVQRRHGLWDSQRWTRYPGTPARVPGRAWHPRNPPGRAATRRRGRLGGPV